MSAKDGLTELMVEAQNVGARKVSVGAQVKDGSTKWTAESGKVTTWKRGVWERMSGRLGTNEVAGFVYVVKEGKLYAMPKPNAPRRGRAKRKAERRQAQAAAPAKGKPTKKKRKAEPAQVPAQAQVRANGKPVGKRRKKAMSEAVLWLNALAQATAVASEAHEALENALALAPVRARAFKHDVDFDTMVRDARRASGRTHVKSDGYRPDVDVRATEDR